jgi:hypothetical protein
MTELHCCALFASPNKHVEDHKNIHIEIGQVSDHDKCSFDQVMGASEEREYICDLKVR